MEDLKPRVARLSKVQLEQRELGDQATEETVELVQRYNEIISTLTDVFIQADQAVSKVEQQLKI